MKITSHLALPVVLLTVSSSVAAFVPSQRPSFGTQPTVLAAQQSRQDFLAQTSAMLWLTTTTTTTGLVVGGSAPANAAKYGKFGGGSPEVLDPAEAIIDQDILKSESVQSALKKVKNYKDTVLSMTQTLEGNPQANVRQTILQDLDFSKLRGTLNTVNAAFDEDTQRGTDRLIRVILQDITELEAANTQKEGIARSERRLDIMKAKLAKLDQAFSDYLAFAQ